MDDLISRQAAIDAIYALCQEHRPDWCPLVTGAEMEETMKIGDRCFVH